MIVNMPNKWRGSVRATFRMIGSDSECKIIELNNKRT